MQLYSFIAAVLLFSVVRSQNCNFINLQTCTSPVIISLELGQKLLMTNIIESSDLLCSSMNRDEFEKLAKCAKDDDVCSREIFKTNETDPYEISAKFAAILSAEHQSEANRIKLIYDVICDKSCVMYLQEATESAADANGGNMGNPCPTGSAAVGTEIVRLQRAQGVGSPDQLNVTEIDDLTPLCNLHQKFLECTLRANLGKMGTCNSLKNAVSKAAITQAMLAPAVANSPLASECANLEEKAYNAYFTGYEDPSSADYVKFSSLLISMAVGVLFYHW